MAGILAKVACLLGVGCALHSSCPWGGIQGLSPVCGPVPVSRPKFRCFAERAPVLAGEALANVSGSLLRGL